MLGVSVIICCYNSESRIVKTLEFIKNQRFKKDIQLEVVLINNASTDNTEKNAKSYWEKSGSRFPLEIYYQPIPGLTAAKSMGVEKANYEFLLFCDDDNWLSENYVETVFDILKNRPNVGVVGGRSEAAFEEELPFWFHTYQHNYAVGVQALNSGIISSRGHVWGAGMTFRKSIYLNLLEAGFHHGLIGRKGDKLSAGEDSEICKWFLLAGYDLYYDERLFFYHFIPQNRLTKSYLERMREGFSVAQPRLDLYDRVLAQKSQKSKNQSLVRLSLDFLRLAKCILSGNKRETYKKKVDIQLKLPNWVPVLEPQTHSIISAAQKVKKLNRNNV
jgi:glycosyltransferase involved in cell wall biosynthesis